MADFTRLYKFAFYFTGSVRYRMTGFDTKQTLKDKSLLSTDERK